jgi:GTP-binding protein EngB required for normal cell division
MSAALFHQQKTQAFRLLDDIVDAARRLGRDDAVASAAAARASLADGRLTVVFAGRFKQGKSSLINALMGVGELMPVAPDPTTSLVTTVRYADTERVDLFTEDTAEPRLIARAEIADFVTEQRNARNRVRARQVDVHLPAPQLRDGLLLVDTPGVDSALNPMHTEVTYRFLPQADVVVYVNDVLQPLNVNDLDFVQRAWKLARRMLFVVTKRDLCADAAVIVDDNRRKIAAAVGVAPEAVEVVAVSASLAEAHRTGGDPDDRADSNFDQLESRLWGMLEAERSGLLLAAAAAHAAAALGSLAGPLSAELGAIDARGKQELEDMQAKLTATQQRLRELQSNGAEWRGQLSFGLEEMRAALTASYGDSMRRLRRAATDHIDNPRTCADAQALANLLTRGTAEAAAALTVGLRDRSTALREKILRTTGVSLSAELGELTAGGDFEIDPGAVRQTGPFTTLLNMVSRATIMGGAGLALGKLAVATLFIAPPVGLTVLVAGGLAAAGGFNGIVNAYKDSRQRDHQELRAALQREVQPALDAAGAQLQSQLQSGIMQVQHDFTQQFGRQLEALRADAERELQSVSSARKLSEQQAAARAKELTATLAGLKPLDTKLRQFVASLSRPATRRVCDASPSASVAAAPSNAVAEVAVEAGEWADA